MDGFLYQMSLAATYSHAIVQCFKNRAERVEVKDLMVMFLVKLKLDKSCLILSPPPRSELTSTGTSTSVILGSPTPVKWGTCISGRDWLTVRSAFTLPIPGRCRQ